MTEKHLVVGSNVIEKDGEFLLVKEGKEAVKGIWNLPAGTMEDNENPVQTAEREAREEAGLDVEPQRLLGVFIDGADTTDSMVANFAFRSAVESPEPEVPEEESVVEYGWFSLEEIRGLELRAPYIIEALQRHVNEGGYPLKTVKDLA
ncbi:MAG: NUDIX domain-containing protein [Candidatus Nanohaloarchaeota archaeon QJJ-7]|nr:NUDIX domain-containing protein [Candidatus Nanohaloarchaeota archaeon QJJ-7]